VVDQGHAAPLTATEKAAIARHAQQHHPHPHKNTGGHRRGKSHHGLGGSWGKGRKKSLNAGGAVVGPAAVESSGEGWRPGFYLGRLLGGGGGGGSGDGGDSSSSPSAP
jgi:hypothetical protein